VLAPDGSEIRLLGQVDGASMVHCSWDGEITDLSPGLALTIPHGASFQFRSTGAEPLSLVISTSPPWPGADEAVEVDGPWPARLP
jgi:mannose-6-phosphate isomerase-like protein (cupin superfamily)